jgi:glutamate racemase
MKLGICDYGIGGMGLYKLIRKKSDVDIVYISDSGYTPYGKVSEAELTERIKNVIAYFHSLGVDYIAVACNAASTVIPHHEKITGVIQHGINLVLKTNPKEIAITGGARTLDSNIYKNIFEENGIKTVQRVAQQLSIRIEAGDIGSKELDQEIIEIIEPIKHSEHILLACTHYPAIAKTINKYTSATLLDPSEEMATWILENWAPLNGNSKDTWLTTGDPEKMKYAAGKSFQIHIEKPEKLVL